MYTNMSYDCEYCGKSFSAKRSLNHHQATASYCLELQQGKGLKVSKPEHKCSCGSIFTQKSNLKRHEAKCSVNIRDQTAHSIVNYNGPVTNNNIQNNINVNVTYTMGSLTPEHIIATLKPLITMQTLKDGMSALTDIIIDVLLQKDGKYMYCCTDRSRKQFKMLLNHKGEVVEKPDSDAFAIRRVLHAPLCDLVNCLTEGVKDKAVVGTAGLVQTLKSDGKKFTDELAIKLPNNCDGVPDELIELFENSDRFALEQQERQQKINSTRLLQSIKDQKKITQAAIDDIIDKSTKRYSEGNYWYSVYHWVIDLDKRGNPIIIGYAPKITDKMLNLTKAQIQTVTDMGLAEILDKQYCVNS